MLKELHHCIEQMRLLREAFDKQTDLLKNYQLDQLDQTEKEKVALLQKYEKSFDIFLQAPKEAIPEKIKILFLGHLSKLKIAMSRNKLILESLESTRTKIMQLYKSYYENQLQLKTYGYSGKMPRFKQSLSVYQNL